MDTELFESILNFDNNGDINEYLYDYLKNKKIIEAKMLSGVLKDYLTIKSKIDGHYRNPTFQECLGLGEEIFREFVESFSDQKN